MSTQCEFRGQWTAHSCCRTAPSGVSAAMTRPLQRTSVHSPRTRPRSFAQSEDGDVCRFWCSVLLLLPILGCYLVWEHKTGVSQLAHHTQPRELHTRNSPTFKSVVSDSDQAQALIDEKPHSTAPARFGQVSNHAVRNKTRQGQQCIPYKTREASHDRLAHSKGRDTMMYVTLLGVPVVLQMLLHNTIFVISSSASERDASSYI